MNEGGRTVTTNTIDKELLNLVAKETKMKETTIEKVIALFDEGNTVPFIARYRKEITGGLDEVDIKLIQDKWGYALNLSQRKEEVLRIIEEQGKLTEELEKEIKSAEQLQRVEDLYRPYKQKRRTRATKAKEKGLGKDVEFYLEFFKYGCPPHGGFGMGVDRITMLLLETGSLKETMFLFRGPSRLTP